MSISPPITWFGGKSKLAARIVSHFPEHWTYVEPFGGSAAVLLAKAPSRVEVYNDIDRDLVNLFQILRDPKASKQLQSACESTLYSRAEFEIAQISIPDPVEAARRFIVRQRQSHGGMGQRWSYCIEDAQGGMSSAVRRWLSGIERLPAIHRRLKQVQIEADDWSVVMNRYDSPRTLFYLDPPYAADTRVGGGYRHELSADDHRRLIGTLLKIRGMAVLSGYRSEHHAPLQAAGWQRIDYEVPAYISPRRNRRLESLWLSPSVLKAQELPLDTAVEAMRVGAYRTHFLRVQTTEAKVLHAIDKLRRAGHRITFSAVARQVDMSREHLSRRYRHLFDPT